MNIHINNKRKLLEESDKKCQEEYERNKKIKLDSFNETSTTEAYIKPYIKSLYLDNIKGIFSPKSKHTNKKDLTKALFRKHSQKKLHDMLMVYIDMLTEKSLLNALFQSKYKEYVIQQLSSTGMAFKPSFYDWSNSDDSFNFFSFHYDQRYTEFNLKCNQKVISDNNTECMEVSYYDIQDTKAETDAISNKKDYKFLFEYCHRHTWRYNYNPNISLKFPELMYSFYNLGLYIGAIIHTHADYDTINDHSWYATRRLLTTMKVISINESTKSIICETEYSYDSTYLFTLTNPPYKRKISKLHIYFMYNNVDQKYILSLDVCRVYYRNYLNEDDYSHVFRTEKEIFSISNYQPFHVALSTVDIIQNIMERTTVYDKFIAHNELEENDPISGLYGTGCLNIIGDYIGMFEHAGLKNIASIVS
jgi:hypothetical protein